MLPRSLPATFAAAAPFLLLTAAAGAQIPVPPIPTIVPTVVPNNAAELAAFLATKQTVPHCCDQLGMYRDLMYATPGLQASQEPREPAPVCGRRFWESRGATARTSPVEPAVGRLPR